MKVEIHKEQQYKNKMIKGFAFDYKTMLLVMLVKDPILVEKKKRLLKIVDCNARKLMGNIAISDPLIIGRIKSGIFKLVDGHFYFGNDVYKIRLDLFKSKQKQLMTEEALFDNYKSILDLSKGEKV